MKMNNLLIISTFVNLLVAFCQENEADNVLKPKTWVLLVAGSKGWYNYRHQADICHAYQIVKAHGIPDENIITMIYDDIAYAHENPTKGSLINHPQGSNVYKGVKKDYVGKDVTPKNFLNVLTGNKKAMHGIGSGKVINSNRRDRIFVNFVDHGGPGILSFPEDELTVGELQNAIKYMYRKKMYADMVMYIEACESGSMFRHVLPLNHKIFVTTASNYNESSYACYYDEHLNTYIGDCYSVNWMENTDKMDIDSESLEQQFMLVKSETNESHVQQYGDLSISNMSVGEFQGEEQAPKIIYPKVSRQAVKSQDVPLIIMKKRMLKSNDFRLQKEYKNFLAARNYVEKIFKAIAQHVAQNESIAERWLTDKPARISNLQCHSTLVHLFSKSCFNFGSSPYALRFAGIFANMCNDGVSLKLVSKSFFRYCYENNLLYKDGIN